MKNQKSNKELFTPYFENLYENKIIYYERFVVIGKLEKIKFSKDDFSAIFTPELQILRGDRFDYNTAFIIDGDTKDELMSKDPKSAEIIKPILRGRDIKRYKADFSDLWLINTHNGYKSFDNKRIPPINVENYPAIKEHLDQYWDKISKRGDKGITPYNFYLLFMILNIFIQIRSVLL